MKRASMFADVYLALLYLFTSEAYEAVEIPRVICV